ncbi:unnamed protein product [Lampetra planeri]
MGNWSDGEAACWLRIEAQVQGGCSSSCRHRGVWARASSHRESFIIAASRRNGPAVPGEESPPVLGVRPLLKRGWRGITKDRPAMPRRWCANRCRCHDAVEWRASDRVTLPTHLASPGHELSRR